MARKEDLERIVQYKTRDVVHDQLRWITIN